MTKKWVLSDKSIETHLQKLNFGNGNGKSTTFVWPEYGYFKKQLCNFGMKKENFPKNSIIYVNQGYLTIKDNKKLYYRDYYITPIVNECKWTRPEDLENYVYQDREVKIYRPRYGSVTGNFLGLYETLGYIGV